MPYEKKQVENLATGEDFSEIKDFKVILHTQIYIIGMLISNFLKGKPDSLSNLERLKNSLDVLETHLGSRVLNDVRYCKEKVAWITQKTFEENNLSRKYKHFDNPKWQEFQLRYIKKYFNELMKVCTREGLIIIEEAIDEIK